MSTNGQFKLTISRIENYLFQIDFGEFGKTLADEPKPLGNGEGPSPAHLLAASVANCLVASLLFAIKKYKGDPGEISAEITGTPERDENNRLRIKALNVCINLHNKTELMPHLDRALEQFEEFCTITQSVRAGIKVNVNVKDQAGTLVHQGD